MEPTRHTINDSQHYRISTAATEQRFTIRLDDKYDDQRHEIMISNQAEARALVVALVQWSGWPLRSLAHLLSLEAGSKAGLGGSPDQDVYRVVADLLVSVQHLARIAEDSKNG